MEHSKVYWIPCFPISPHSLPSMSGNILKGSQNVWGLFLCNVTREDARESTLWFSLGPEMPDSRLRKQQTCPLTLGRSRVFKARVQLPAASGSLDLITAKAGDAGMRQSQWGNVLD